MDPSKKLEWIVDNDEIRIVPLKADPIAAFRGRGKGGSVKRLLQERKRDTVNE